MELKKQDASEMQRRLSVFRLRALAACWHLDKPLSAATWHAGAPAGARLLRNLRHNWSRRHQKKLHLQLPFRAGPVGGG